MNLIDVVNKLIERGCKQHPRLIYYEWSGTGGAWYLDKAMQHEVAESDARDLWMAHALRWLNEDVGHAMACQRWQGGWNVFLDEDYWDTRGTKVYKFTAPGALDAIEAATWHLAHK